MLNKAINAAYDLKYLLVTGGRVLYGKQEDDAGLELNLVVIILFFAVVVCVVRCVIIT